MSDFVKFSYAECSPSILPCRIFLLQKKIMADCSCFHCVSVWCRDNFFSSQGLSRKISPLLQSFFPHAPVHAVSAPAAPPRRRHARNCTLLYRSRTLPLPSPRLLLTLSSPPSQAVEANLLRQLEQTLAADPSSPLHHYNLVRFVLHCINLAMFLPALLRRA